MPTVYDVPVDDLIKRVAEYLKENTVEVKVPLWSAFVKTGSHLEGLPQISDWWHIRSASILRKVYLEGPIGVGKLRKEYGGRLRKGTIGEHKRIGGGKIIRDSLQQLEKAGLIKTVEKKGRVLTETGIALLDSLAGEVKKNIEKHIPELKKYG